MQLSKINIFQFSNNFWYEKKRKPFMECFIFPFSKYLISIWTHCTCIHTHVWNIISASWNFGAGGPFTTPRKNRIGSCWILLAEYKNFNALIIQFHIDFTANISFLRVIVPNHNQHLAAKLKWVDKSIIDKTECMIKFT